MSGNGGNLATSAADVLRVDFWSVFSVRERIADDGKLEPCLLVAITVISYIVNGVRLSIFTSNSVPGTYEINDNRPWFFVFNCRPLIQTAEFTTATKPTIFDLATPHPPFPCPTLSAT